MTLAKAAPTDWAKWFATVTGQPLEYVRAKLEMAALSDRLATNGSTPGNRCANTAEGLAIENPERGFNQMVTSDRTSGGTS